VCGFVRFTFFFSSFCLSLLTKKAKKEARWVRFPRSRMDVFDALEIDLHIPLPPIPTGAGASAKKTQDTEGSKAPRMVRGMGNVLLQAFPTSPSLPPFSLPLSLVYI
jgi:hypothetical protein